VAPGAMNSTVSDGRAVLEAMTNSPAMAEVPPL
jgi:hypothetical protein